MINKERRTNIKIFMDNLSPDVKKKCSLWSKHTYCKYHHLKSEITEGTRFEVIKKRTELFAEHITAVFQLHGILIF